MFNLSGKTAVITGASGLIGSSIAKTFYSHGAETVVSGTKSKTLKILAKSLGSKCHFFKCNLNNREEVKELIQHASKILKNINIIVNNAGIRKNSMLLYMDEKKMG